jgi:hypothetical protein
MMIRPSHFSACKPRVRPLARMVDNMMIIGDYLAKAKPDRVSALSALLEGRA